MANSSMSLLSLDTKTMLDSLIEFSQNDPVFRDYNMRGSSLQGILRTLAYNTWLNSFYVNQAFAEGFLDSAQTRSSLISHSKELNYTPRSAQSAKATINLTFTGTEPTYLVQKGSTFSSIVKNSSVVFSVPESILLASTNNYFQTSFDIYEGAYVSDSYVVNYSDDTQRFLLTNPNIDTRSLSVVVYEDGSVDGVTFTKAETLLDLDETDKVFFLQAAETGQYEVVFGDDVIGRRPLDGATVLFDYRVTRGDAGNGAKVFTIDFQIGDGVSSTNVATVSVASSGAPAETEASIRYNAPRHFQTQERAVTARDYTLLLQNEFPEIAAVSVFGGEEANPPQYGRVIVAVDVADVDGIPAAKKDEYYRFLKSRCGLTITPVFVEPKYTYLSIRSVVTYNLNVTTLTAENIKSLVKAAILTFADDNLNDFESTLRYSKILSTIDNTDDSIVGNETEIQIYKRLSPVRGGSAQSFTVNFDMPLYDGYPAANSTFPTSDARTLRSGNFIFSGSSAAFLTDDGDGKVWVAREQDVNTVLIQKVGTVDYATGLISISGLAVDDYDGPYLKLYAKTADSDVMSGRDTILVVETDEVIVNALATRE